LIFADFPQKYLTLMQYTCGAHATVVSDLPIHPICSLRDDGDAFLRRPERAGLLAVRSEFQGPPGSYAINSTDIIR
jgi:hypothetical protein